MPKSNLTELRSTILKALSDPVRLEIIELLKGGERCVCEVIPALGKSQSTVSKNLDLLYKAGILERRVDGKKTLYRIGNSRVMELLKEVDAIALDHISSLSKSAKLLEESVNRG
uniref:ArsR family transcriptional regulator n=1 Tax=Candidatus Methanomethylicus mesodigestus TaxID=1867258 RepID=A0A7C3J4E2_9CREN